MSSILAETLHDMEINDEALAKLDALRTRVSPESPPKSFFSVIPLDDITTVEPVPHCYAIYPTIPLRAVTVKLVVAYAVRLKPPA